MKKSYKKPEACCWNKENGQISATSEAYAVKSKVIMDTYENRNEEEERNGDEIPGKF